MLVITTPADDPYLLTIEQARVAAGLAEDDDTQDAVIEALRASVSGQIYDALNIAVGSGAEPTIREETLTEVVLTAPGWPIILRRRHNVEVISIEGWPGVTSEEQYFVEAEAGILRRFDEDCRPGAKAARATVVYKAGFAETPPVLVAAASELIRLRKSEAERDPLVKKTVVDVDGLDRVETDFWVTAAGATAVTQPVPPSIMATIKRFRNSVMI